MTPFRLRLLAVSFFAVMIAISGNALYLQAPPQFAGTAISETSIKDPSDPATASLPLNIATDNNERGSFDKISTPKTSGRKIDLDHPSNKQSSVEITRAIQRELIRKGYNPGEPNGKADIETRAAIIAYEFDEGLPLKGKPTEGVLKSLIFGSAPANPEPEQTDRFEQKEELVIQVQNILSELGYMSAPGTGQFDTETQNAIQRFEKARGLPAYGRLTARILIELVMTTNMPLKVRG